MMRSSISCPKESESVSTSAAFGGVAKPSATSANCRTSRDRVRRRSSALAEGGGMFSALRNLAGLEDNGVEVLTDVTPLGQETGIPWLAAKSPGEGVFFACEMSLRGVQAAPAPRPRIAELAGDSVTLAWDDGSVTTVELPAPR